MNDDLISRQAVLALPRDRIRNMRGEIVEETIDVAFIEQLPPAQPEQRWIPYSENSKKLPEDRQRCLVTIRDGREPEIDIVGYATDLHTIDKYDLPDSKPGWYGFDSEYGYYEQTGVTAWMPLPESYREEGEK